MDLMDITGFQEDPRHACMYLHAHLALSGTVLCSVSTDHSSQGGLLNPPFFRAPPPFQFCNPFLKYHRIDPYFHNKKVNCLSFSSEK